MSLEVPGKSPLILCSSTFEVFITENRPFVPKGNVIFQLLIFRCKQCKPVSFQGGVVVTFTFSLESFIFLFLFVTLGVFFFKDKAIKSVFGFDDKIIESSFNDVFSDAIESAQRFR